MIPDKNWVKLIDIGKALVLLTKEESDNESPAIGLRTDFYGVSLKATMGYDDEETRDKEFEEYDKESAEKFFSSMEEMIKGNGDSDESEDEEEDDEYDEDYEG